MCVYYVRSSLARTYDVREVGIGMLRECVDKVC